MFYVKNYPFLRYGGICGVRGQQKWVFLMEGLLNIEVPRFARGQLAAANGNEPGPAARSHRSTRAGGQDDVSSNLERSEGLLRACTGNCPWSFVILLFHENI